MNTRLQQFLNAENITQSQFADTLGVARASISHLLAGRNKPSFDFIESVAANYPAINLEWLITGVGRMYKSNYSPNTAEKEGVEPSDDTLFAQEMDSQPKVITSGKRTQLLKGQRNISKIVVFYDDGTFQELSRN